MGGGSKVNPWVEDGVPICPLLRFALALFGKEYAMEKTYLPRVTW